MTTKSIRELAQWVKAEYGGHIEEIADKALLEVEAIERAAKNACAGDVTHRLMASDSGLELGMLLESIAKDAP